MAAVCSREVGLAAGEPRAVGSRLRSWAGPEMAPVTREGLVGPGLPALLWFLNVLPMVTGEWVGT